MRGMSGQARQGRSGGRLQRLRIAPQNSMAKGFPEPRCWKGRGCPFDDMSIRGPSAQDQCSVQTPTPEVSADAGEPAFS